MGYGYEFKLQFMALERWVDLEKKHTMKMKEMTLLFSKQIMETCRRLKNDHNQSILANQNLREELP